MMFSKVSLSLNCVSKRVNAWAMISSPLDNSTMSKKLLRIPMDLDTIPISTWVTFSATLGIRPRWKRYLITSYLWCFIMTRNSSETLAIVMKLGDSNNRKSSEQSQWLWISIEKSVNNAWRVENKSVLIFLLRPRRYAKCLGVASEQTSFLVLGSFKRSRYTSHTAYWIFSLQTSRSMTSIRPLIFPTTPHCLFSIRNCMHLNPFSTMLQLLLLMNRQMLGIVSSKNSMAGCREIRKVREKDGSGLLIIWRAWKASFVQQG